MDKTLENLKKIREEFPELTFNNVGYQYIHPTIREKHKEQISEVLKLLQERFPLERVMEFNNFKDNRDGSFYIRCQTMWSDSFKGVHYFTESNFLSKEEEV